MKWCGQAVCLWHAVPTAADTIHEWKFSITSVKTLTRCRRSARTMFLYVHENSDDFHVIFPSSEHREMCYQSIVDMMREVSTELRYGSSSFMDIKPHLIHVCKVQIHRVRKKRGHVISDYNSRLSWWIFISFTIGNRNEYCAVICNLLI